VRHLRVATGLQRIRDASRSIDVFIEGAGPRTVVMIHGWPDTHRLWDSTVTALKDRYRCVRFTLPGFDPDKPARPTSLPEMVNLFGAIVDAVCPDRPVTLVLHDWGCIFGYEFATRHPGQVERIVAVDIGDYNSDAYARTLTGKAKWQIFSYQCWLALAWALGTNTQWRAGRPHDPLDGPRHAMPNASGRHWLVHELPLRHAMVRPARRLSRRGARRTGLPPALPLR
jgi:pimeloyl-ACP methyl ester carboxylesterase